MKPITFRPTEDSLKAIQMIRKTHGINQSQAINSALVQIMIDAQVEKQMTKLTRKAPKPGWKA